MQGTFLTLTIGFEFFLLVGYMFYLLFRTYSEGDDKVSLMRWVIGLIGILTLGLIVIVARVAMMMSHTDLIVATTFLIVDVIGLYLLIDDSQRVSDKTQLVEKT